MVMKAPIFFLAPFILSLSSIAFACRCARGTAWAYEYFRGCVTSISTLLVSSAQSVSDITTCQDERLGDTGDIDDVVVSSEVAFLSGGETFTVTVRAVSDAVFFYDGETIAQIAKPTVTFSQRMRCWWERISIFDVCECACSF
jgi:hypothetical protein